MKFLIPLAAALAILSTAAFAGDRPEPDGCYRENFLYPWLNLPSEFCTAPALGDPDHISTIPDKVGQPRHQPEPPPVDHCPYGKED